MIETPIVTVASVRAFSSSSGSDKKICFVYADEHPELCRLVESLDTLVLGKITETQPDLAEKLYPSVNNGIWKLHMNGTILFDVHKQIIQDPILEDNTKLQLIVEPTKAWVQYKDSSIVQYGIHWTIIQARQIPKTTKYLFTSELDCFYDSELQKHSCPVCAHLSDIVATGQLPKISINQEIESRKQEVSKNENIKAGLVQAKSTKQAFHVSVSDLRSVKLRSVRPEQKS
jgi:hypothetical protein